jgi:hypothetical protein
MVATWGWWLGALWVSYTQDVGTPFRVMLDALDVLAEMSAVFFMLTFLVAPVVATARMWREIGAQEQRRNCKHPAHDDNVVAFRPTRYGTASDS